MNLVCYRCGASGGIFRLIGRCLRTRAWVWEHVYECMELSA